jgi:hypothetical protein
MKNRRLWRQISRRRQMDKSLRDQLEERAGSSADISSYLEACQRAPHASESTKRKWRKVLGY